MPDHVDPHIVISDLAGQLAEKARELAVERALTVTLRQRLVDIADAAGEEAPDEGGS